MNALREKAYSAARQIVRQKEQLIKKILVDHGIPLDPVEISKRCQVTVMRPVETSNRVDKHECFIIDGKHVATIYGTTSDLLDGKIYFSLLYKLHYGDHGK